MRKLEIKEASVIRIAVQQEIGRSEKSRYDHRLHGILLVCSGLSCYKIAEIFNRSPRTIQYWVKRFEESGFSGLEEIERSGRPSIVDTEIRLSLENDLRKTPRECGCNQNLWDSKLFSYHLLKKHNIKIGERHCRRIFHQMGFRQRKPRTLIANADEELKKRYKKK